MNTTRSISFRMTIQQARIRYRFTNSSGHTDHYGLKPKHGNRFGQSHTDSPTHRSSNPDRPRKQTRVLLAVWILTTIFAIATAFPTVAQPVEWRFIVDGKESTAVRGAAVWTADSVASATAALQENLSERGFWFATVDSVVLDQGSGNTRYTIYSTANKPVNVVAIQLIGFTVVDSVVVRAGLASRPESPVDASAIRSDVSFLLGKYSQLGYGLAEIRASVEVLKDSGSVRLRYVVDEGDLINLVGIELAPEIRSSKLLVARLAGVGIGKPLRSFDENSVREGLVRSGLFRLVGEPQVQMVGQGEAILSLPLVEASPGSFDLVLGFLPGVGGERGSVVGNGRLQLINLFGGGRTVAVKLNRLPGQTSSVNVGVADPFVLGFPLGAHFSFNGEQRDSTYGKQRYDAGLSYRILDDLELSATVVREVTRPGQAGVAIRNGTQRISRSDAVLAGIGIAYRNVDDRITPRKGVVFESSFERGTKKTTQRSIVESDTVSTTRNLRQERLVVSARGYLPISRRQVLAVGVDARLLRSDNYELSDLFRIGGASTLRGYNEEQFTGRFVNRWLAEYRYLLERNSFAYLFVDVGVVERPSVDAGLPETSLHPGYGIGLQFETGIGIVNATYGLNRDDGPTNGKIHVGLSFAL